VIPAPSHQFRRIVAGQPLRRLLGWLDDGSPILEHPTDHVETFHILPAQPGWHTLQWGRGDNGELEICKTAIIAWKITTTSGISHLGEVIRSTWTTPIVADSTDMDELNHVLLSPDNIVHQFETDPQLYEEWLAAKKQQTHEHPVE
jgi:hypothetical protein